MRCQGTVRPTVVLFLWWRSRIFVYRKASSSTHCATSSFRTVFTRKSSNPRGFNPTRHESGEGGRVRGPCQHQLHDALRQYQRCGSEPRGNQYADEVEVTGCVALTV